jgi:DNA-binding transcriptional ArsR family regulator
VKPQGIDQGVDAPEVVMLLRAVAEPQRLALLAELADASRSVGELVKRSGLAQASVSHHLAILRRAGLVVAVREGRRRCYAWAEAGPRTARAGLVQWLRTWCLLESGVEAARNCGAGAAYPGVAYPGVRRPELDDHLL